MAELSNNLINGQTRSKYIEVTHRESQNRLLIIKQCFWLPFHLEIKLESFSKIKEHILKEKVNVPCYKRMLFNKLQEGDCYEAVDKLASAR